MSQFSEVETTTAIRMRRAKPTDIPGILAILDQHLLAKKIRSTPRSWGIRGFW